MLRPHRGLGRVAANLINDALAPLGVHLASQPMSPSAIVSAIMARDDAD
jgi:hypothetical protein